MMEKQEVTYEMALATQLYLLTESDQIKESGEYPESPVPTYVGMAMEHKTTLHVVEGYHVPTHILAIQENTPERIVWQLIFAGENEWQHDDGSCTYTPINVQLWYIREQTMLERVTEQFDWLKIIECLDTTEQTLCEDSEGYQKMHYIGTIFQLSPSGKYYTPFANSNVTQQEADLDEDYWNAVDGELDKRGMWRESGEGSASDIFFCRAATSGVVTKDGLLEKPLASIGRKLTVVLSNGASLNGKIINLDDITLELESGKAEFSVIRSMSYSFA
jgi:hypothetical protein